jgi:DNA-binding transcriptional ArsR family regulator
MLKVNPVVNLSSDKASRAFAALADPTRRQMLSVLTRKEASISELALPFKMTLAGASKHVRVLEQAGLVDVEKQGRTRVCRFNRKGLRAVSDVLGYYEKFWSSRLDALEAHLQTKAKR